MSFLPINEENKQAPTGQTTNAPGAGPTAEAPPETAGGSAGTGPAAKGGSATGTPTQFGSSASKLGDYLTANAPQVGQQAEKVAGGLNTQYQGLQSGIQNAANQFGEQVKGGYNAPNQQAVQQAIANPTQFVMNPESVKAFQGQYNNAYTGPQSFTGTAGYGDIQGQVQAGQKQANLLGTQAGLQSFLQGNQGNPTRAGTTLDALLLRGNPGAQQTIQNAANQFGGLTGQLGTATTGANQSVADAQKAAQDAQAYARGQFDPYAQNFGNQINQGAQTAEAGRTAYNTGLNKFYAEATPFQQQINQWAGTLPGNAGASVQDLVAPIIAKNQQIVNPITTANYATPEQYAQAAALQQLGGAGTQVPLNQANIGQTGTAGSVPTANLPTLKSLAEQYAQPLGLAFGKALDAGGTGWNPTQAATTASTGNLAKYLSQFAPETYPSYGPGGYSTGFAI